MTGFLPIAGPLIAVARCSLFFSEAARWNGRARDVVPMLGPESAERFLTANVKPEEWDAFKNINHSEIASRSLFS